MAEIRKIESRAALAALAHPLRRRLIDLLSVEGAATVGMLAERTGQNPGNISHHVRVLARAGFVAEDTGLARDRREHWWRSVPGRLVYDSPTPDDSPSQAAVATAAELVNLDRHAGQVREWLGVRESTPEWVQAAFATDTWLRLTPEELAEIGTEINEVLLRWARRELPADGAERRSVLVFAHGVPGTP